MKIEPVKISKKKTSNNPEFPKLVRNKITGLIALFVNYNTAIIMKESHHAVLDISYEVGRVYTDMKDYRKFDGFEVLPDSDAFKISNG